MERRHRWRDVAGDNGSVVRARRRVRELEKPLRRALAALSEVERLGQLDSSDVFGRYVLGPDEDLADGLSQFLSLAREDYPNQELEVIVVIAGEDRQRGATHDQAGSVRR